MIINHSRARSQWRWRGNERPPFAVLPSAGQESVWDYPRPPRLAPDRSHPQPLAGAGPLADCVACYASVLECRVAGALVVPKPGGFDGGWITPELVGPFKGEPGSMGW